MRLTYSEKFKAIAIILLFFSFLALYGCQGTVARKPVAIPDSEQEKVEKEAVESPAEEVRESEVIQGSRTVPLETKRRNHPYGDLISNRLNFYKEYVNYWTFLDQKIKNLNIDRNRSWQRCGTSLQSMIDHYEKILMENSDKRALLDVLSKDFEFLQEKNNSKISFAKEKVKIKDCRKLMSSQASNIIKYHSVRKQYEEIINTYEQVEKILGKTEDFNGITESYGLALVKTGDLEKGLRVLLKVLEKDGEIKKLTLRREAITYLIALGDFNRARAQLEEIDKVSRFCCDNGQLGGDFYTLLHNSSNQELKLYGEALHSWLVSDKREIPSTLQENLALLEQNAPESQAAKMGMQLREQADKKVENYTYQELGKAVDLVKENNFKEALQIVYKLKELSLPADSTINVRKTEAAILKKQSLEKVRQAKLREKALATRWNVALDFLDGKEYDKALEYFRSLLDTDYRQKAQTKITEAIRLAATAKRQKAAELFLKARETEDLEIKADYLHQSRNLLLEVKEKYPEAGIINKVENNLDVVEETLRQVDPDSLNSGEADDGFEISF